MFDLKDYKSVAERVLEASPDIQSVVSSEPVMMTDTMGYVRVVVTMKDGRTGSAMGSFSFAATKSAQKTHPLEDAETSALGRALGFLGYASSRSLSTAEDVQEAQRRDNEPSIAQRQKTQALVQKYQNQCIEAGLRIEHDLAGIPFAELSYDEMVTYGKYLKGLLG